MVLLVVFCINSVLDSYDFDYIIQTFNLHLDYSVCYNILSIMPGQGLAYGYFWCEAMCYD